MTTKTMSAEEKRYTDLDMILADLSDEQISSLSHEANASGDDDTVDMCAMAKLGKEVSRIQVAGIIRSARVAEIG